MKRQTIGPRLARAERACARHTFPVGHQDRRPQDNGDENDGRQRAPDQLGSRPPRLPAHHRHGMTIHIGQPGRCRARRDIADRQAGAGEEQVFGQVRQDEALDGEHHRDEGRADRPRHTPGRAVDPAEDDAVGGAVHDDGLGQADAFGWRGHAGMVAQRRARTLQCPGATDDRGQGLDHFRLTRGLQRPGVFARKDRAVIRREDHHDAAEQIRRRRHDHIGLQPGRADGGYGVLHGRVPQCRVFDHLAVRGQDLGVAEPNQIGREGRGAAIEARHQDGQADPEQDGTGARQNDERLEAIYVKPAPPHGGIWAGKG